VIREVGELGTDGVLERVHALGEVLSRKEDILLDAAHPN
jgi:hypothetical protein